MYNLPRYSFHRNLMRVWKLASAQRDRAVHYKIKQVIAQAWLPSLDTTLIEPQTTGQALHILDRRPSLDFGYEAGKTKLVNAYANVESAASLSLITPGDLENHDIQDQGHSIIPAGQLGIMLKLCAKVDIESRVSVGCAGAVLTYLQRRRAVESLPRNAADSGIFRISAIEMFNLKDTM